MEKEWNELQKINVPFFASIYGASVKEFEEVARAVAEKQPSAIEINISCPNTQAEGQVFGVSAERAADVVSAVRQNTNTIPLIAKLTPQALDIAEIACACEAAGADAINAINTLGPGMIIDIEAREPILSNKQGGISGPAIRPIAIRCVYDIFERVAIPIIGTGGITSGRDAIEMIQAGATCISIGSAVHYRGIGVFRKIAQEMAEWMKTNNVSRLEEIRGIAHE